MSVVIRSNWVNATVIENHQWTDRLYSLRLIAPTQAFKAGQFIRVQLPVLVDGIWQSVAKSYSLVNAPHEAFTEIFYNRVPNGVLSNALAALKAGDTLEISQPANGFFVLDELPNARDLWLIATGTGLGPYLSILKTDEIWQRFESVVLVHGVPLVEELVYADLIEQFKHHYAKRFQFISCVTRENNPAGLTGRVTTLLENGALEAAAQCRLTPEHSHIMLCGNHQMLDDMKKVLATRGLQRHLRHKAGHITTEQYF